MQQVLFTFGNYWHFYLWFSLGILFLLVLDLGVFNRKAHVISMKEAATWSVVWIVLALSFNAYFYWYALSRFQTEPELLAQLGTTANELAKKLSLEFLTGFVVEKSLAVDNLFIFVVIFTYFNIPAIYQHRVLFYGIIGALIFRAIFIALGSVLMQYEMVIVVFGVLLILTGIKLLVAPEKPANFEKNLGLRLARRLLPITDQLHGQHFLVRIAGKTHVTPLFLALLIVEFTDIVFAVDSVPAIFALTSEPLIVFTSNVFAILGLRSLYFLLLGVYDRFHLLKYGLGLVLIFVGCKMTWLNHLYGGKFPISASLAIICTIIAVSVGLSLWLPKASKSGA